MSAIDELHGFDDDAIRGELIRLLDREEARLTAKMLDDHAAQRVTAEKIDPKAQSTWDGVEGKIRKKGSLIFGSMRSYVQRSR